MKWDIEVIGAGVYRHAQCDTQRASSFYVGFTYSGLKSIAIAGQPAVTHCPMLTLFPAGTEVAFEFGVNRENWVVFLQSQDFRQGRRPGCIEVNTGRQWLEIPWHLPVDAAMADWWQAYFMRLHDLLQSPTPANRLLAEMMVVYVIQQFFETAPAGEASPEHRLKTLIDHDLSARRSLSQMARQCGYSADHLRVRFETRFGLSPIAYRQRRRMAKAMEHVTRSRMAIKQIATTMGFTQVAHFSAAFRQAYDMTPTQAIERFRRL